MSALAHTITAVGRLIPRTTGPRQPKLHISSRNSYFHRVVRLSVFIALVLRMLSVVCFLFYRVPLPIERTGLFRSALGFLQASEEL